MSIAPWLGTAGSRAFCRLSTAALTGVVLLAGASAAASPLPQPTTVTGTVKSADGVPISGARVVVASARPAVLEGVTDANGQFSIAGVTLPATLEVSARGFSGEQRTTTVPTIEIVLAPAVVTESVVVTPERESTWRDPASGTTVISREDLDRIPAVTTDEALRVVSGFSLFRRSSSRSANPTTHGVTLRGLSASGSSRGLVLLDGVPLNDGFGGWVTWTRVPPAAIARIDVDRGAEGEAVGSDALGGLIRIVTPDPDVTALSIGAEGGSPGVGALDVAVGGRVARASAFGAGSWFRTDGTIPVAPESRGPVDQPTDARWANLFGRLVFAGTSQRLTFTGWGGSDDRGNGTVLQRNRMSGGTAAGAYQASRGKTTLAARLSVSPNHFYQTFSSVNAARTSETLTSTQNTDGTTTRVVGEVGRALPRGQLLATAALNWARVDFSDARATVTTTQHLRDDSEAVAVQAGVAPLARLTLSGGARHEWRAAPTTADSRDQATVGRAMAAFQITDRTFLRSSVASSHRWPTLNELVRNFQAGNVLTRANPNLLPEHAKSADVSIGTSGSRWQASIGGFWTVVDDAIANVTISSTGSTIIRERRNAGDAHARGLEVDVEARPTDTFRVRASGAFTDARFRDSLEPALEGNRLPQVPKASGSITMDWAFFRGATASLLWHGVSPQYDDDRNQFLLASASQFDLQLAGPVGHFRWQVVIENTLDNRVEVGRTPLVTLAPGRAVRAGLTWLVR